MNKKIEDVILVIYFASILTLCFVILLLPIEVREMLKVRCGEWNPLNFFMSTFVHVNLEHLRTNAIAFLFSGFLNYCLIRGSRHKHRFFMFLLINTLLLPFINNTTFMVMTSHIIDKPLTSCGLSIIVAGMTGLLVPSLIIFLKDLLHKKSASLLFTSLILLTGATVSLPYASYGLHNLAFFTLTFAPGLGLFMYVGVKILKESPAAIKKLTIAFTIVLNYIILLSLMFPSEIIIPGLGIVNILAHYVGVLFGIFFGSYALDVFKLLKASLLE